MSTEDKYTRVTLRLPKELDERLSELAEKRSSSKNSEIIQRLERSIPPRIPQPHEIQNIKLNNVQRELDSYKQQIVEQLVTFGATTGWDGGGQTLFLSIPYNVAQAEALELVKKELIDAGYQCNRESLDEESSTYFMDIST